MNPSGSTGYLLPRMGVQIDTLRLQLFELVVREPTAQVGDQILLAGLAKDHAVRRQGAPKVADLYVLPAQRQSRHVSHDLVPLSGASNTQ